MQHQFSRRWLTHLCLLFLVLSLVPAAPLLQAQTLDDAAARFDHLRAFPQGQRTLPQAPAGVLSLPEGVPDVDQAERLQKLVERWRQSQTASLAPPSSPAYASQTYLPLVASHAAIAHPNNQSKPQELAQYRTATSTIYVHADGRWEQRVYAEPVHYQDIDGQWQQYAPAFASDIHRQDLTRDGVQLTGSDLDVWFATPSKDHSGTDDPMLELYADSLYLQKTLRQAQLHQSHVEKNSLTYTDVFTATDLRYSVEAATIYEEIVLYSPPSLPMAFSFDMSINGGRFIQRENHILIEHQDGSPAYVIQAPVMRDAKGTQSSAVAVTLKQLEAGRVELRYTPDAAWLADPQRMYPVSIQDTISPIFPAGDTYVSNNKNISNIYHWQEAALFLGFSTITSPPKGKSRFLMNFQLPALPADVLPGDIDSADISLYQYHNEGGQAYDTHIYTTNDPWDERDINWDNHEPILGDFGSHAIIVEVY